MYRHWGRATRIATPARRLSLSATPEWKRIQPLGEGWFRSLYCALREGRLYLVGTHPRATALAPSPSERWHSTSLELLQPRIGPPRYLPLAATHKSLHPTSLAPSAGGLAPEESLTNKGDLVPLMLSVIRGLLGYALSGPSPKTCFPWDALPGA